MYDLLRHIKDRTSDPKRFLDAAEWVRPLRKKGMLAEQQDVDEAERRLGFFFPALVRRLYTEIGNGGWGPYYGFYRIPVNGAEPTDDDLVGCHLACVSSDRMTEEPLVEWPRGLVSIIGRGCNDYELCDFLKPPHPVFLLSGDKWGHNTPIVNSISLIADSLEGRLEQWLETATD